MPGSYLDYDFDKEKRNSSVVLKPADSKKSATDINLNQIKEEDEEEGKENLDKIF
jgi:hypothetical protein